jgi:hypothetical protein
MKLKIMNLIRRAYEVPVFSNVKLMFIAYMLFVKTLYVKLGKKK